MGFLIAVLSGIILTGFVGLLIRGLFFSEDKNDGNDDDHLNTGGGTQYACAA